MIFEGSVKDDRRRAAVYYVVSVFEMSKCIKCYCADLTIAKRVQNNFAMLAAYEHAAMR